MRHDLATPSGLREQGPGIFYSDSPMVTADWRIVDFLKAVASTIPVRRARLCAHAAPEDEQHDMLIVSHRDTYVAPHRHTGKSETMLVLEGQAEVYLFSENGAPELVLDMGPPASGRSFFYRMPRGRYHGLDIATETLVFVESTKGPFRAQDMDIAPWAPAPDDVEAGREFVADVRRRASNLGRSPAHR